MTDDVSPQRKIRVLPWVLAVVGLACIAGYASWRLDQPPVIQPFKFVQSSAAIGDLVYTADGRMLVATGGGLLRDFDTSTGRLIRQFPMSESYQWPWISLDGTTIVDTVTSSKPLASGTEAIDGISRRVLRKWNGTADCVSPDGSIAVIAPDIRSNSQKSVDVTVVDVRSGKPLGHFATEPDSIFMRISLDNKWLCVPSDSGPSRIFRLPEVTPVYATPPLNMLRVTLDGKNAVGISRAGNLFVIDLKTGAHSTFATGMSDCYTLVGAAYGHILIEGQMGSRTSARSVVQIRSADGLRVIANVQGSEMNVAPINRSVGTVVAYGSNDRSECDVFSCDNGRRLYRLETSTDSLGQSISRQNDPSGRTAVSPDGRHFAYGTSDGLLRLYDVDQPKMPSPGPISNDAGQVVSAANEFHAAPSETSSAEIWNAPSQYRLIGKDQFKQYGSQESDDHRLVAKVWTYARPNTRSLQSNPPAESWFVELSDTRTRKVIRLDTKDVDARVGEMWGGTLKFAFSQDDSMVAAASDSSAVVMWSTTTGTSVGRIYCPKSDGPLRSPTTYVPAIAFSPDGRYLVAGRDDGSIYLYSMATRLPVAMLGRTTPLSADMSAPLQSIYFTASGHAVDGVPYTYGFGDSAGKQILEWPVPDL